jgi:hypothetical protein
MSDLCKLLHEEIARLPLIKFPFNPEELPDCGIYFFYEKGEYWGHGGRQPRIVRIGSCKDGNFQSRISDHYLFDQRRMDFDSQKPAPKDRSIFRKNLGRALLAKQKSDYSGIWERDFTKRDERRRFGHLRNIRLEQNLERQITRKIRETMTFRFIAIKNQMGSKGLESRFIGTVAQCGECKASSLWLGQFSPKDQIRQSGMWLIQHLNSDPATSNDISRLKDLIKSQRKS